MSVSKIVIYLLLVVFFLAMNAFFVIAEFSVVRVRKSQIELAAEEGKKGAKSALEIVNNVNAYLSACQLGITLASLALGWLGEPVFAALIRPLFAPFAIPEAVVSTCAVAIGYFLMTTLHVVVGELIPKSMAIFSTEAFALRTAVPLLWFYRLTYPIMWLFNSITNGAVRLMGHEGSEEHDVYTGDEIKILVDESTESGLIDPAQNEYVDNVLDLVNKDAAAIMTPRTDVVFLDINDSAAENLATAERYSYSRYPICDGDGDHLKGFVHVKDLFHIDETTEMADWPIRELIAVPETCKISKLIGELTEERTEICAVVDEHGGTAGIATLSDVLEQIVGKINDEYRHVSDSFIKEIDSSTFEIDGSMPIANLFDTIGFEVDGCEAIETAAGLVMKLLDKIPEVGEEVSVEHETAEICERATFKVVHMENLRVERIVVSLDKQSI